MRGGQENKKAADGGERAKARRSPGTAKGSSWPAPRAGLSRVFFLPQQSDGKAAISGHHRQPATARPVDHRLTLDPCGLAYSLLRPPASTPKVVAARGWTTGLTARVSGPARRDEMGRAGRPGPAGEGLARDETGIRARAAGSIALTSAGEGRLAGRNRGRDPKGDALFIRGTAPKPASEDQGPWSR